MHSPLEIQQRDKNHYTLNGTPADCVIYGLSDILSSPPDLVISGINHGANLGDDIMYSGTVAGAREASRRGIAALAISQAYDDSPIRYSKGAKFIKLSRQELARAEVRWRHLPEYQHSGAQNPRSQNHPAGLLTSLSPLQFSGTRMLPAAVMPVRVLRIG